jgi:Flp pilus assembly pilin Flp
VTRPQRSNGARKEKAFRNVSGAIWNAGARVVTAIADRLVRWMSRNDQRGQAMVEYALIMVLVVVVVIVILIIMGNTVKNMFCNVTGSLGSP